ncbi:hypothetical protein BJ508DRAFT_23723 [Ascobolus immersus RN42]|uniref:Uncharacterized protein n=1 Tax=Ascobolus immersus RN42 TaxID=1160509 RepID=A0A3N4HTM4_ASCIM|nr:hypothetical protein BJ508DRAFT_23723 [Ascobolus immersus RN42]
MLNSPLIAASQDFPPPSLFATPLILLSSRSLFAIASWPVFNHSDSSPSISAKSTLFAVYEQDWLYVYVRESDVRLSFLLKAFTSRTNMATISEEPEIEPGYNARMRGTPLALFS